VALSFSERETVARLRFRLIFPEHLRRETWESISDWERHAFRRWVRLTEVIFERAGFRIVRALAPASEPPTGKAW
jgi:hypothetical protein